MNARGAWFEVGDPIGAALRTIAAIAGIAMLFAITYIAVLSYVLGALYLFDSCPSDPGPYCDSPDGHALTVLKNLLGAGGSIFAFLVSAGSAFAFAGTGRHLWARRWIVWMVVGVVVMALVFGGDRLGEAFDPSREWPW